MKGALKRLLILLTAAHASFFLLPGGVKRDREKTLKQKKNKANTHTSLTLFINGKAMGLSTRCLIYNRACAMYKKGLSSSVLDVAPDVSGE